MHDRENCAGAALLLSSVPDEQSGRRIAEALVNERLAACAHVAPAGLSVYRWQGRVVAERESMLTVKTTKKCAAGALARLVELHPYDVPEALVVPCPDGGGPYLDWLAECCARR